MVQNTATAAQRRRRSLRGEVRRALGVAPHASGSRRMELPLADLVPGDVVLLSAGDMIPADCRILTARTCSWRRRP